MKYVNILRGSDSMITNPKHGWCSFKLGDFQGSPSYLTDVAVDLLDAFIDYYVKGYGVAVFDEEGSFFTLVLTRYNWGIFLIEEKDCATLHDFSDMNVDDLSKELVNDIEHDLNGWYDFLLFSDENETERYQDELDRKLAELKYYI